MFFRLKGVDKLLLLLRGHPSENGVFFCGVEKLLFGVKGGGVHKAFIVVYSRKPRHLGDGFGLISRNDLYIHALLGKVFECGGGIFSHGV